MDPVGLTLRVDARPFLRGDIPLQVPQIGSRNEHISRSDLLGYGQRRQDDVSIKRTVGSGRESISS